MSPTRPVTPSPSRKLILPATPPTTPRITDSSVIVSREVVRFKSEFGSPPSKVKRERSEVPSPSTPTRKGSMGPPATPLSSIRMRASSLSPRRSLSVVPYPLAHIYHHVPRSYSRAPSEISLASEAESFFALPIRSPRQSRPRAPRQGDVFGDGTARPASRAPVAIASMPAALDLALKSAKDTLGEWKVKEKVLEDDDELVMMESVEQLLCEVLFDGSQFNGEPFQNLLARSEIRVRPAQISMLITYLSLKVPAALSATLSDFANLTSGSTKSKDRAVRAGYWWEAVRGGLKMESGGIKACMTRKVVNAIIRALYIHWAGEKGQVIHQALKTRFGGINYGDYLDAIGVVRDICGELIGEAWA